MFTLLNRLLVTQQEERKRIGLRFYTRSSTSCVVVYVSVVVLFSSQLASLAATHLAHGSARLGSAWLGLARLVVLFSVLLLGYASCRQSQLLLLLFMLVCCSCVAIVTCFCC